MAAISTEQLTALATPEVLSALRQIAQHEGASLDAVVGAALREYVERRSHKDRVKAAFGASLAEFDPLYRELAK